MLTGKSKLFMDGTEINQSKEKGKPFLIPTTTNEFLKAFPKQSFPDYVPTLEINGVKNQVAEKLKWFEYLIGGLPILLLFLGGAIGGAIGVAGAIINFNIFRQEGTSTSKYLKVIGIVIGCFILYLLIAGLLYKLVN